MNLMGLPAFSAVVKKGNQWLIGSFNGDKFIEKKKIKKLGDVKGIAEYMTLKKFLKSTDKEDKLETQILEQTKLDKIYVLDKPYDPTEEEWDEYWWSDNTHVCKSCIHKCKQSNRVTIYKCSKHEKKISVGGNNGKIG